MSTKKQLIEKLETSTNPMSLVVRAQLKSLESQKADDNTKFAVAKELIRECYKQGYSRDELQTLAKFIDWVIRLPESLENRLIEEITKIEEEFKMAYLASWERKAMKQGIEEGMQKGIEKGLEKGLEKGMEKGKLEKAFETAKKMLKKGFDLDTVIEITGLNRREIEKMA